METFFTPEEVAERLSVETTTVYSWLKTARLTGVKLGRLWRVRAADLKRFTEKGWAAETPSAQKGRKADALRLKTKTSNQIDAMRLPQQKIDTSWIDNLPQIDLSRTYPADTIFSREEMYSDDVHEHDLYGTTVPESAKG